MTTVYGDLVRYRELFGNLFRRDVQAKYRGSILGLAWTLANPVLLMAVYLLVFSVLWKTPFGNEGHYALFLLVGLSAWVFFATSVQSASRSLLDNANLIHWANPLSPVVEALHDVLFYGHLPSSGDTIYTVVAAFLALALGAWVFT